MDRSTERIDGVTPNGGAYMVAFFRSADGTPAPKSQAEFVEITEYDVNDVAIHRTYGVIEKI